MESPSLLPIASERGRRRGTPGPQGQGAEVISLGCRLNAFEGESMRRLAAGAGLDDAVIVNGCAVTNEAVRQTRQAIRRARRDHPGALVVATGCAAQIDPQSFSAMPEVDAVLGNAEKLDPGRWRALRQGGPRVAVDDIFAARESAPQLLEAYGERSRAFLQVQTGCDHRCTFCIIPYGRGRSRSTPADDVIAAARRLVADGRSEIVLTGVDITSYGGDLDRPSTLGRLVSRILDETAVKRLRLSSIDGAEIDDELFDLATSDERVAPHLHLSLQSGDDLILKRMKRRHARAQSIEFCHRARALRPEIAFGADLIVGFPTETEAMFERSLALIDDAGLDYVHVFPFSPRAGTPAARMPQLDGPVVARRARRMRNAAQAALHRFLDRLVGQTFDAVVEVGGRARLGNFAPARIEGRNTGAPRPGSMIRITATARDGPMLVAELA
jgi:threonylcarbamoyladenosine tRNA methylthiotransferase MtaB